MLLQHMKMQILGFGLLILAAYAGGKIAKKFKIGEVIGQIVGGILVGPHFLELIHRLLNNNSYLQNLNILTPIYSFFENSFTEYSNIFKNYHFFVFLFLGVIAFSIGEELHRDRLKQVGIKATFICIIQAIITFLLGFLGFWLIFDFSIINSLIIGSIGIATAPALTLVLMNKLKIEGSLRNILANIVVLDDIIEVVFFSIFLGIAITLQHGETISALHIGKEVGMELFFAALIGLVIFLILKFSIKKLLEPDKYIDDDKTFLTMMLSEHPTPSVEILIFVFGIIAIGISLAINFNLPFLITAVVAGFLISNFHSHGIFDSLKIENVMPIFNLLFFAIIGASVRIESFSKETLIFVIGYLILRSIGKLFGNWIGCRITDQDPKITACLPKLMLPQAGMAAVETILVATVLKKSAGTQIFNTIIPALVVFELVGAWLSEKTLYKWKSWTVGEREAIRSKGGKTDLSLSELIENRVIDMVATNKNDAIFELSEYCVKENIVSESIILTNLLREREKLASTGIGDGVALPHCKIASIKDTIAVCGILRKKIDWNSPDKKPIDLLILLITPEKFPKQHLKAIKTVSSALKEKNLKNGIKNAYINKNINGYLKDISS